MRIYLYIHTSPRSGEVGRGSGRVGPVEPRQFVVGCANRPSPGLRARPSHKRSVDLMANGGREARGGTAIERRLAQ
jgi:hypothetical protein